MMPQKEAEARFVGQECKAVVKKSTGENDYMMTVPVKVTKVMCRFGKVLLTVEPIGGEGFWVSEICNLEGLR